MLAAGDRLVSPRQCGQIMEWNRAMGELGNGTRFLVLWLIFCVHGIDNPHDDRDHAGIGILERLTRAVAFAVDEHRVADARLGVVERDEVIFGRGGLAFQRQWLDDQQTAVLVVWMADGGDDGADNFSEDH